MDDLEPGSPNPKGRKALKIQEKSKRIGKGPFFRHLREMIFNDRGLSPVHSRDQHYKRLR